VSFTSPIRVVMGLLVVIITLTIIAKQPFVTAVLLPILTGLFVVYADRWIKVGERTKPSAARLQGAGDWLAQLPVRVARTSEGSRASSPEARILLTATLCLFAIGAAMVYSASSRRPGLFVHEDAAIAVFFKFAVYGSIGVVLMMLLARDGLRIAHRFTAALLLSSFVLVLGTHVPHVGVDVNGARRWIGAGNVQFQPSELMKIALVLYGAQLIANRPDRVNDIGELAQPLLYVTGAGCLLVIAQPDLGTAMVIAFAMAALLLGAGVQIRTFALIVASALGLIVLYALARPYSRARLTTFIDPWAHASGSGFQAVQGQIAIGSGGLFGRGLGESIQKAYYLPQANTGFIFAVLGEELGFVGVGVLLFLYGLLSYSGLRIARSAKTLYSSLVATGLTSMIVAQAVLNVFSVLGLAPEAGVALPFVSYGSSDLLIMFVAVGLLLNIAREGDSRHPRSGDGIPSWVGRLPTLVRARIGMLTAFFFILLLLAGGRSLYLSTVQAATLRRAAANQQLTQELVPAPRGTIADRFGTELVGSEAAAEISADPYLLTAPEAAASELAPLLGEPTSEVLHKLTEKTGFVYLVRGLPINRVRTILDLNIPGISASPTTRRTYPHGSLAGQVLGIVGSEERGLSGLEYGWDKILRGEPGERRIVSNAIGQPISVQQTKKMIAGAPLQLTLDSYVQAEVEYVLADTGQRCNCSGVAAVVMNPNNGEVLALANWPRIRLGDASLLRPAELEADLENRILTHTLEPGAMVDVFSLAGALQEGLANSSQVFVAPARMQVGADMIEDGADTARTVTAAQLAAGASKTGTLRIASQLGLNRVGRWLRRFGLGTKTGIDLPGENPGRVPSDTEYGRTTLGTLPIGQDIAVTPIQLAAAYAAIANGGTLRAPHVVADVSGKPVAAARSRRVLSGAVARSLRRMLGQTAGTGVEAAAINAAGKRVLSARDAAFVGFAPSSQSQVLTVTLVTGQRGETNAEALAASAYRQITAFVLPYLGTR
jgi:cell division protein FtsW